MNAYLVTIFQQTRPKDGNNAAGKIIGINNLAFTPNAKKQEKKELTFNDGTNHQNNNNNNSRGPADATTLAKTQTTVCQKQQSSKLKHRQTNTMTYCAWLQSNRAALHPELLNTRWRVTVRCVSAQGRYLKPWNADKGKPHTHSLTAGWTFQHIVDLKHRGLHFTSALVS